jgi:predicted amidohydrolase
VSRPDDVQPLRPDLNHSTAKEFIRSAAASGAHLAVLPEYHLTSWVPDSPEFIPACRSYKTYLDSYCQLAAELHINIVPGTLVHPSADNEDDLINVAYFISHDGTILSTYQKKNLWHPERPHLTSSLHEPHRAFDTPLGRVGMLICWDLAFPEAFRELIADGARIIIIPTFWTLRDCNAEGLRFNARAEALFLDSMVTARTFENTCAVVFVNAGGPSPSAAQDAAEAGDEADPGWCGLTQVAVPFVGGMGKLGAEEGMSVVDLDMRVLDVAEDNYKVRADMGKEGWHYAYTLTRELGGQESEITAPK